MNLCTQCNHVKDIVLYGYPHKLCKDCYEHNIAVENTNKREEQEISDHSDGCSYYRSSPNNKECECPYGWFDHKRNCACECDL